MKLETMIKEKLTARDVLIMRRIAKLKEATPTILACPLVSTVTITRIGDMLIDKGWAERVPSPADRRSYFLSLTDAGREVLK